MRSLFARVPPPFKYKYVPNIAGTYLHHRATFRGGAHFFLINPETRREVPHAGWLHAWDAAASSLAPFPPGPGALAAVLSRRRCPDTFSAGSPSPSQAPAGPGSPCCSSSRGSPCSQVDSLAVRVPGMEVTEGILGQSQAGDPPPCPPPSSLHLKAAAPATCSRMPGGSQAVRVRAGGSDTSVALWFGSNARCWLSWRQGL